MSTPNPYHESPFAFHIAVKRVRLTLVIEEKNIPSYVQTDASTPNNVGQQCYAVCMELKVWTV